MRRLGIVLANLAGVVGLWLILEFVCSLQVTRAGDAVVRHPRLDHTWPPGERRVHREWARANPEYDQPYVHLYNRQGWLESYDIEREKPPGTYRIFYVGDSFAEGTVPMDQSVPSRVEAALNRRCQTRGWRFEVVNTGTMSYSPLIYYVLVRYFISDYAPDLVVVNVDMSDVFDDWKYRRRVVLDEAGDPWAVASHERLRDLYLQTRDGRLHTGWVAHLRLLFYSKSFVYNWILNVFGTADGAEVERTLPAPDLHQEGMPALWAWCEYGWGEVTKRNVELSMDTLERLGRWCHGRGIRLLLTGVPHYQQFARSPDGRTVWSYQPHEEIRRAAARCGAAYLDSWAAMAPRLVGTAQYEYYYRGDMHFNPAGYAAWAEAHIQALLDPELELLPASCY